MRTVPFYDVWKAVVARHGLDPDGDQITYPTARAITRAINRRTRIAWRAWDWPDFSITEERSYRQVWNSTHQYLRSNPALNGQPDEVFYLPASTVDQTLLNYYSVNPLALNDPPVGIIPPHGGIEAGSGLPFWLVIAPLDPFVSMDQVCQRAIGRVIGIYKSNPRLDGFKHSGITFRITEKGIDLFRISGPTIFVKYLPAPSRFTMIPWRLSTDGYRTGDLVFYWPPGETYVSLKDSNTATPGADPLSWRISPMPEVIASYVEAGAYADCMRESHPVDAAIAADSMAKAALADVEAKDLLQFEIDVLMAMGQRHSYQQHRPPRRWTRDGIVNTPAWQPGSVTTLTDICKADGMYPGTPGQRGSLWFQGTGAPNITGTEVLRNDMYLNTSNGDVWQFDGVTWAKIP